MGEYADYLIDRAMDNEFDPFSDEDEDWPGDYTAPRKTRPTCKRCGKSNLIWAQTLQGWRLYEGYDRPHVCQTAATSDDFTEAR